MHLKFYLRKSGVVISERGQKEHMLAAKLVGRGVPAELNPVSAVIELAPHARVVGKALRVGRR